MAKIIDVKIFERYRDQATVRWIDCEMYRFANNGEYEGNRRLSRWLNIATVFAALATAIFATLLKLENAPFSEEFSKNGALIAGLITGAIPTLKEAFKWDARAGKHKEFVDLAKATMLDLRTWVDKLAFGKITAEDETMISRANEALKALVKGEASLYENHRPNAEALAENELGRISFLSAAPVAVDEMDDEPDIVTEDAIPGFERAVRR